MSISSISNLASHVASSAAHPDPQTSRQNQAVIKAAKAIQAAGVFGDANEVTYSVDRATRQVIVRVMNRETQKVVEQIPPEYVLKMAEELKGS